RGGCDGHLLPLGRHVARRHPDRGSRCDPANRGQVPGRHLRRKGSRSRKGACDSERKGQVVAPSADFGERGSVSLTCLPRTRRAYAATLATVKNTSGLRLDARLTKPRPLYYFRGVYPGALQIRTSPLAVAAASCLPSGLNNRHTIGLSSSVNVSESCPLAASH